MSIIERLKVLAKLNRCAFASRITELDRSIIGLSEYHDSFHVQLFKSNPVYQYAADNLILLCDFEDIDSSVTFYVMKEDA